jgi:hypothetical protein
VLPQSEQYVQAHATVAQCGRVVALQKMHVSMPVEEEPAGCRVPTCRVVQSCPRRALLEYGRTVELAVPILPSRDLRESLAFYERLGFENRGAPPERWDYLIIGRGGMWLHFFHEVELDPFTTAAGCYLFVDDAQAVYDEWAAAGVPDDPTTGSRLVAPKDTDYGMREFALVDPSGNLLRVGSGIGSGLDDGIDV